MAKFYVFGYVITFYNSSGRTRSLPPVNKARLFTEAGLKKNKTALENKYKTQLRGDETYLEVFYKFTVI